MSVIFLVWTTEHRRRCKMAILSQSLSQCAYWPSNGQDFHHISSVRITILLRPIRMEESRSYLFRLITEHDDYEHERNWISWLVEPYMYNWHFFIKCWNAVAVGSCLSYVFVIFVKHNMRWPMAMLWGFFWCFVSFCVIQHYLITAATKK